MFHKEVSFNLHIRCKKMKKFHPKLNQNRGCTVYNLNSHVTQGTAQVILEALWPHKTSIRKDASPSNIYNRIDKLPRTTF